MWIICDSAKKNAALAMRYKLRMSLISSFKAKIVPMNKIIIQVIYNIRRLIPAIYITNKIMDFW